MATLKDYIEFVIFPALGIEMFTLFIPRKSLSCTQITALFAPKCEHYISTVKGVVKNS